MKENEEKKRQEAVKMYNSGKPSKLINTKKVTVPTELLPKR